MTLGLLLFALALGAYKAGVLTASLTAGWQVFSVLWVLDGFYFALLLVVAIGYSYVKSAWLQVLVWLMLLMMTAYYLLDSFVVLALNDHADLFDIGRYAFEWDVVQSFIDGCTVVAIVLLLASLFLLRPVSRSIKKLSYSLLLVLFVVGILGALYAPEPLLRYAMLNPLGVFKSFHRQQPVAFYTAQQIAFYRGLKQPSVHIPASKPDVIMVIVESLSAINSSKVSGVGNLLGRFDLMAEDGVLFQNFFANHQASEGGIISLLSGFPPMHFPTATAYMFDEFAQQPSVIGRYREEGYYTEFLTNAELQFIGLDRYLAGLGIDRSRGRDEVESMRSAPRIVQGAPADNLLYDEALITLQGLSAGSWPFLLILATTSTHLPYTNAGSGPDSAAAVWDWSLQQLTLFCGQLKASGFFENGVLLITGDHRQMRPLTRAETARYGASARARVPLLVIGKGFPHGPVDKRFFQQADLLRDLGKIRLQNATLSPHPIWVERYNRKYGHIELIDNLSVFDEADAGRHEYRLKVPGNRIEWLGDKPSFAREVETTIHMQRSLHQQLRH